MPRCTTFLPLAAILVATQVCLAQPQIVPLEQERRIRVTVSGQSAEAESVYILESEADSFDPFYAGITGELFVDTAIARGVGGHYSHILISSLIIGETTLATAGGELPTDSAACLTESTFMLRFIVTEDAVLHLTGLNPTTDGDGGAVEMRLLDAKGRPIWEHVSAFPEEREDEWGTLAAGEYTFIANSVSSVETTGKNPVSAAASLLVTLDLLPMTHGPKCACDWNRDGVLDSEDLFEFLDDFLRFDADFDGSGSTESGDLFAFLSCLLTGC